MSSDGLVLGKSTGAEQAIFQQVLATLAREHAAKHVDAQVVREGTKIILPEGMTIPHAIDALTRRLKDEETVLSIDEVVNCFPLDGAYGLMRVLKEMFGWTQAVPTPGFWGDTPPRLMTLEVDHGETTQVIWGDFIVPGVDGKFTTGMGVNANGQPHFKIFGKCKKRDQATIKEIADRVRQYVSRHSIYRGKAIRLQTDANGKINFNSITDIVRFLDLSRVNPEELTFSKEVAEQVQTSLFTPIEKTDLCRAYKIPLKRGVLLEGKYGTGKTLTAYVTAKKCTENGWTFIYLDRVTGLKDALALAKLYAPAVLFAEDVDRATSGERNVKMDDILNTIDGIESKNAEIITILTTNYVENIDKAMLRPGRLDAVITVHPPDHEAAQRLVKIYGRGLIDPTENLDEAGRELDGQIPAVIREVVERSKLAAVSRLAPGESLKLIGHDIAIAARGMKSHLALLEVKKDQPTAAERLGSALQEVVLNGTGDRIKKIGGGVTRLAKGLYDNGAVNEETKRDIEEMLPH